MCRGIKIYSANVLKRSLLNPMSSHRSKSFRLHQATQLLVIIMQLSSWSSFAAS